MQPRDPWWLRALDVVVNFAVPFVQGAAIAIAVLYVAVMGIRVKEIHERLERIEADCIVEGMVDG